jgi:CheY-like chemotaxis protein
MATATVLLYSDDPQVRDRMRLAAGTRPAPDLEIEFVEAGTYDECLRILDEYEVDLVVLDGEAAPAGGIGIARQLKDEFGRGAKVGGRVTDDAPPTCVVIARAADRWLAAYARVDATLVHPLDPVTTGQTIAGLLRRRIGLAA